MTTGNKIMWKREEIVPKEQFLLFSTLFYIYISNFRSQITYSFVKCGCSIYCFSHSLNSDMSRYGSRSVSVSPLEFEITRVDCSIHFAFLKINEPQYKKYTSDMCSQRKPKLSCAYAQSDLNLCYPHEEPLHPCIQHAPSKNSDETIRRFDFWRCVSNCLAPKKKHV